MWRLKALPRPLLTWALLQTLLATRRLHLELRRQTAALALHSSLRRLLAVVQVSQWSQLRVKACVRCCVAQHARHLPRAALVCRATQLLRCAHQLAQMEQQAQASLPRPHRHQRVMRLLHCLRQLRKSDRTPAAALPGQACCGVQMAAPLAPAC